MSSGALKDLYGEQGYVSYDGLFICRFKLF